jgi:hypothetical protein
VRPRIALLGLWVTIGPCFSQPPFVTCDEGQSVFRSAQVSSGQLQAYAVTEAHTDPKFGCSNVSRLYVGASGRPFEAVYTLEPRDASDTADSLMPVA